MSWAPAYGEDRRKDHRRAHARAQRLRKAETPTERRLWKLLRVLNKDDGGHFRRQTHVGDRVFDFADLSRRILIEVDGGVHQLPAVREADREKEIDAILRGYQIVRIANDDVWRNSHLVIENLRALIASAPPPLGAGVGGGGLQDRLRHPRRPRRKGFETKLSEERAGANGADESSSGRPHPLTPAPRGGGSETI